MQIDRARLVRAEHMRGLLRLLGEVQELPADSTTRRRHALRGVAELIGAAFAAMVEIDDFRPGASGRVVGYLGHHTLSEGDARRASLPIAQGGCRADPAL